MRIFWGLFLCIAAWSESSNAQTTYEAVPITKEILNRLDGYLVYVRLEYPKMFHTGHYDNRQQGKAIDFNTWLPIQASYESALGTCKKLLGEASTLVSFEATDELQEEGFITYLDSNGHLIPDLTATDGMQIYTGVQRNINPILKNVICGNGDPRQLPAFFFTSRESKAYLIPFVVIDDRAENQERVREILEKQKAIEEESLFPYHVMLDEETLLLAINMCGYSNDIAYGETSFDGYVLSHIKAILPLLPEHTKILFGVISNQQFFVTPAALPRNKAIQRFSEVVSMASIDYLASIFSSEIKTGDDEALNSMLIEMRREKLKFHRAVFFTDGFPGHRDYKYGKQPLLNDAKQVGQSPATFYFKPMSKYAEASSYFRDVPKNGRDIRLPNKFGPPRYRVYRRLEEEKAGLLREYASWEENMKRFRYFAYGE